ncbi:uncharacterized protein LOC128202618 [Galleria mellonella]|uniref:Uncharacterized protein LOC128202618 n=1 Tax=Galleria mellonella TaxID=7137 RepID=A0ABM3N7F6_GALME|nr:uncharacterized protein LOC128202618 [Galleria mellonella]
MYLIVLILVCIVLSSNAVRLHKIFQFIDGFKSEYNLSGWLHIGNEYSVFIKVPNPHDKYITYELYESKYVHDLGSYKPKMLAVSKIPVEYLKEQLKMYRKELYKAKYVDSNTVPGTQLKTLRDWQIDQALENSGGKSFGNIVPVLRTVL